MLRLIPCLLALLPMAPAAPAADDALKIVNPVYRQYDDGPTLPADFEFQSGDVVFVSFQIANFKTEKVDGDEMVKLSYQFFPVDSDGVLLVEPILDSTSVELTEEDKKQHWMPKAKTNFHLPPLLLPGEYKIRLRVQDRVSGQEVEESIPLHVGGREIEPSDTLVARNFRFVRSETESEALSVPAYRPGDTVFARFEITGYKIGEKNAFSVDYGIAVADEAGNVLFQQQLSAEDKGSPYYPRKFLRGFLSVVTKDGTPLAKYQLILTLHDRIGDQSDVSKHVFSLE